MDSSGIRATSAFPLSSGRATAATTNDATAKGVEKLAATEGVSSSGKGNEKDQLDIASGSLRDLIGEIGLFGVKPRADGAIHIEDIRSNYAERFGSFTQKLNGLLQEADIDRGSEAILRCDGEGKIHVTNDHPDREKIEALFEDNPELANEFRGLSGTASFLRAADEASKFSAAYAKDPLAAMERYSHLFDNTDTREFAMRVTNDNIIGFFE